jgi:N-acetylglucosamine PTS system EIICBA or EIICB component
LQVVLGPLADQVAERIRQQLRASGSQQAPGQPTPAADPAAHSASSDIPGRLPSDLLAALGGRGNVLDVQSVASTRLRVRLRDEALIDTGALRHLAPRGTVRLTDGLWQILVGPTSPQLAQRISALCHGADEAPRIA